MRFAFGHLKSSKKMFARSSKENAIVKKKHFGMATLYVRRHLQEEFRNLS